MLNVESAMNWYQMQQQLKKLKEKEMEIRRELCELIIGGEPMEKGRVSVKDVLSPQLSLRAVQTLNYKLDQEILGSIWNELPPEEEDCIKLVPTLKEPLYKKLGDDAILHEAIITTVASPTLTATIKGE